LIVDASDKSNDETEKSQGGRIVGLSSEESSLFCLCDHRSGRVRRVSHGSFGCEVLAAIDGMEATLNLQRLLSEVLYGKQGSLSSQLKLQQSGQATPKLVPIILYTDSQGLVDAVHNISPTKDVRAARRRDIAQIKECMSLGEVKAVEHICGLHNPADALTKDWTLSRKTRLLLLDLVKYGRYTPIRKT
jgi:hypothetical protein